MFFCYPAAANANNWFHDCLYRALLQIHDLIDAGQGLPPWPEILPAEFHERLGNRLRLRQLCEAYYEALTQLDDENATLVRRMLEDQNRIVGLLDNSCTCAGFDELPPAMQEPVRLLFQYAFNQLDELQIRDQQYEVIRQSTGVCPFCGIAPLAGLQTMREDLDHYLFRDRYRFAAANLHNLAPMCGRCNTYKGTQDMVWSNQTSRPAFNPFDCEGVTVSLAETEVFGNSDLLPIWQLTFEPNDDRTATWLEVFDILHRFRQDVLNQNFLKWLEDAARIGRIHGGLGFENEDEVFLLLNRAVQTFPADRREPYSFLREAVFKLLETACRQGEPLRRLCELLRSFVTLNPLLAEQAND